MQDSQRRFPFLAWQNEDITEETKYDPETDSQSPVSNREQFFGNTEVKNPPDNTKLKEAQLTDVLQNAIFSNDKNYIQLYKDLKNGNYNSGTGSLRHKEDKKSDNSGNYEEQVTSALEKKISLYPFTDYTKLYKDLKDSLANSPTTSQPFIEEETERFPQTRNPSSRDDNFQQFSAWNNFQSEV